MKPVQIADGIYWVGGIDWRLRNFHGYLTQRGSSYNAYLIIDEKVTLVDSVKSYLTQDMLDRIASLVDVSKIDYLVANHVEMDHSGAIPEVAKLAPNMQIVCSPKGAEGLRMHYGELNYKVVKTGDSLNLGKRSLNFVQTPMVHWPDNMLSFCPEEKILFSNDAFGQHIATSERFDDELPVHIVMEEAAKYYANIVLPYGNQVKAALSAVSGFEIKTIAPSHGVIWRKHLPEILGSYTKWCTNETVSKAVVVYDTMWDSTAKMAGAVAEAFENCGILTTIVNPQDSHISDIMTSLLSARFVCVGSPTLNNNMLPSVAAFLTYLKGLAPKGRVGMAFGSYGWGGQSVALVEDELRKCGFDLMQSARFQYIPDGEKLAALTAQVEEEIKKFILPETV